MLQISLISFVFCLLQVVEPSRQQTGDNEVTARLTEQLQAAEVSFKFMILQCKIVRVELTLLNKDYHKFEF